MTVSSIKGKFYIKTRKYKFTKICPAGAEFFRVTRQTDRQTDMAKIIVVFRKFLKKPKGMTLNLLLYYCHIFFSALCTKNAPLSTRGIPWAIKAAGPQG